jgi:dihydroflavonol-4-reductase
MHTAAHNKQLISLQGLTMKILVVGGSGLIGGDAALYLQQQGHAVTIMARKKPATPALAALPLLQGDYVNDDCSDGRLKGFDALVFAAAADIRNVPRDGSVTPEQFYKKYNDEAVPRFFRAARDAGIKSAVYIGTFYPQVAPQRIGVCPYVTSRHNTAVAVAALGSDSFRVCVLNPPFVLGHIDGLDISYLSALVSYVKGEIPSLQLFAPKGGTNHITSRSIAHAVLNALQKGESGKQYLIGDENYTWKEYLQLWCDAVGKPADVEIRDDDHPMFPNVILFAGPGATIRFETDAADMKLLDYPRNQVKAMIGEIVSVKGTV